MKERQKSTSVIAKDSYFKNGFGVISCAVIFLNRVAFPSIHNKKLNHFCLTKCSGSKQRSFTTIVFYVKLAFAK